MQSAYMGKLMELAQRDVNIMHLLADSGTGYDEIFRYNFPHQMFNFGISEEHMLAAAAGMAAAGKIPFAYTAGAFLAYRGLEFLRDDICFQNLNVKVVGMGSGLAWSTLGPTHHTTEDVAVLRSLPNLMLLSPATPHQVSACVEAAYAHPGPVYIRIGMNGEKEFFPAEYRLHVGQSDVLRTGGQISVYVTGSILEEAAAAAELLAVNGIQANLINVVSLKPFDEQEICQMAAGMRAVFTVEEHTIYGGLGSMVAEVLATNGMGVPLHRIGLEDRFAVGYGTQKSVRQENGLDAKTIAERIREALR